MTRIRITRDDSDQVHFEEITIVDTDNVFFPNLDPREPHHPSIADNEFGPAPSLPSS